MVKTMPPVALEWLETARNLTLLIIYARKEKCFKSTALPRRQQLAHNFIHKKCEEIHRPVAYPLKRAVLNF
jgi:hypothetical protein